MSGVFAVRPALAIEPFLCFLHWRLAGLVLWELELWLVLSVYADNVLLVVQDTGDLVLVKACQVIYSAASSAWVNWVKSSGLMVSDRWQTSSLPPVLQAIQWSLGPLLYLSIYLSAMHPSPPENWQDLEARVGLSEGKKLELKSPQFIMEQSEFKEASFLFFNLNFLRSNVCGQRKDGNTTNLSPYPKCLSKFGSELKLADHLMLIGKILIVWKWELQAIPSTPEQLCQACHVAGMHKLSRDHNDEV
ncbi:unnamed protein product [Caretta caretta]